MQNQPMSNSDYKKVLVGILKYFDHLCRSNGIKYSLIGGSLIGAIRHDGIIPWDDDIDVILMPEEYEKLLKVLRSSHNSRYKALIPLDTDGYYFPFIKIIDSTTVLYEEGVKPKKDSGIFIDVFRYGYFSKREIKRAYRKTKMLRSLLAGTIELKRDNDSIINILKNIRRITIGKLLNYKQIIKQYEKLFRNERAEYVMSNWPCYGAKKETHETENLQEYTNHKFEKIDVMIFKKYDILLRNTFGDYMTPPPPVDRRTNHHMTAYWKKKN